MSDYSKMTMGLTREFLHYAHDASVRHTLLNYMGKLLLHTAFEPLDVDAVYQHAQPLAHALYWALHDADKCEGVHTMKLTRGAGQGRCVVYRVVIHNEYGNLYVSIYGYPHVIP